MEFKAKKPRLRNDLLQHARDMRHQPTDAERKLWSQLRNRRLGGFKFRRQHPVGPYIIDFVCDERGLAVELDGGQHDEDDARAYDERRARYLESRGIHVIRFWDCDALKDTDAVARTILRELEQLAARPHPNPLPEGEGTNATHCAARTPNPLPQGEGKNATHCAARTPNPLPQGEGTKATAARAPAFSSLPPSPSGRGQGEGEFRVAPPPRGAP